MPEKSQDTFYESAILLDPQGQILSVYHKSHLNEADKQWASPGNDLPVFSTELGRIGMLIGDEVRLPDITLVMAMKHADVIAIPSSWKADYAGPVEVTNRLVTQPYPINTMFIWYQMAKYAQAYTLVANFVGSGHQGGSGLYSLDPLHGHYPPMTASKSQPTALAIDFDTDGLSQSNLMLDSRSDLTQPLLLETKSACYQQWQQQSDKNHFCWDQ